MISDAYGANIPFLAVGAMTFEVSTSFMRAATVPPNPGLELARLTDFQGMEGRVRGMNSWYLNVFDGTCGGSHWKSFFRHATRLPLFKNSHL